MTSPVPRFEFASDNTSGVAPEAWTALERANGAGCVPSYGDDPLTTRAADLLRDVFETPCEVFFVFSGTAANALSLAALCQPYHAVIAHARSHIEEDECGAPAFFSGGTQLIAVDAPEGKLTISAVKAALAGRHELHANKPRALSLTQATEVGTVYSVGEVAALCDFCRGKNFAVHMDGARFANAVVSLGASPADITWRAGIDVLCLGGTKNGMLISEAILFFNKALAAEFDYRCKQAGHLASKMRYLAAPWIGMLENGAWLRHAGHANASARELADALRGIPGMRVVNDPPAANALFVDMPPAVSSYLDDAGWRFYRFAGSCRLMCSWATRPQDIEAFAADCREASEQTVSKQRH